MAVRVSPRRCAVGATAAIALIALLGRGAGAVVVGGGGSLATDCLAVFDAPANYPADGPKQVRCVDGDPTCDSDNLVDGVCTVAVVVCVNSTAVGGCTLAGVDSVTVDHALDNGDPRFDPDFQAVQNRIDNELNLPSSTADVCTLTTSIRVPIKGPIGNNRCSHRTKKLKLETESDLIQGRRYIDRDTLRVTCYPAPANGCDPQTLFAGTFDRVQKQIFNQSCAVSSCHDSNAQAGGLILEVGATPGNLIEVDPVNAAALGAGWKRIDQSSPTAGSPETSFLYRKIMGDLPDAGYGERMPLGRPRLNGTLRDLIEAWIGAGAPATGWVPGTY
ncbi:hypothetical protein L6Q96_20885 [Candidatus Binatia bacterium]|nr:hypothetical protein [Candidatus Binatia bacterium]